MTQCYVFVFVVWSLFCICSTRCLLIFISRFILTFSCGRAVFDNRSTFGLQSRPCPPVFGSIMCRAVYSYKGERIISEIICAFHYKWRRSCYLEIGNIGRRRRRNCNLARVPAANIAYNKHRVKNKEWLGPCSVINLGPRLSKRKLVKMKRN